MLIEFLGWPGSGKTTMARALGQAIPGSSAISNFSRLISAASALLPDSDVEASTRIAEMCSGFARPPVVPWRRIALLRGDRAIALAAQESRQVRIADELFLHALFGTIGPRVRVPDDLLLAIGALVEGTYHRRSVAFIYLRPPTPIWEKRLLSRPAGRSRFGLGGDEQLLLELKRDRLLDSGIVELLRKQGFKVIDVSSDGSQAIADCRQSVERFFNS